MDWEIDPLELTLDDLEILPSLQEALETRSSSRDEILQLKEVLGRLVTNKTAEEIGRLTLRELMGQMETAMKEVEELAVPKATDTPS